MFFSGIAQADLHRLNGAAQIIAQNFFPCQPAEFFKPVLIENFMQIFNVMAFPFRLINEISGVSSQGFHNFLKADVDKVVNLLVNFCKSADVNKHSSMSFLVAAQIANCIYQQKIIHRLAKAFGQIFHD